MLNKIFANQLIVVKRQYWVFMKIEKDVFIKY